MELFHQQYFQNYMKQAELILFFNKNITVNNDTHTYKSLYLRQPNSVSSVYIGYLNCLMADLILLYSE